MNKKEFNWKLNKLPNELRSKIKKIQEGIKYLRYILYHQHRELGCLTEEQRNFAEELLDVIGTSEKLVSVKHFRK